MSTYQRHLDVAAIKRAINPYDFYLRELSLYSYGHRSGSWLTAGLCPFHEDKKAGSFKINVDTGAFKCWSCNAKGGDIIKFLRQRDHLEFREALEMLSKQWGAQSW